MGLGFSLLLFAAGLALLIGGAEKLVGASVGTARLLGVSAFLVSVVFIGFDPENLLLGAVSSYEHAPGIALGTIVGAAMVALALAFGLTALIAPMHFSRAPWQVLLIPVGAVLLLDLCSIDGRLSRSDGALLLVAFGAALWRMYRLGRRGLDIRAGGEVAEALEHHTDEPKRPAWQPVLTLVIALAAIIVGSELVIYSSGDLIAWLGLSETLFGMTILALLVSIEELARELPAALRGRADISYGNVAGSILAFFLFNAGIIALVRPLPIPDAVRYFHLPVCTVAVVVLTVLVGSKRLSRAGGLLLVLLYVLFIAGSYLIG